MARGTVLTFQEFVDQIGEEGHNFASDTLKLGIVDNVITPLIGDGTPTWGDYSANEVSAAGGYVVGGIALTTLTWTHAANVNTLDADNIVISQNGAGFTNAYWGILYNDTNITDMAIAFLEFNGPVSEQAGDININWGASGILTLTRTA